jgi:hypothetical protein
MWYLLQDLNHLYLGQELIIPSPQQTTCMTMSRGPPLRYLLRPENVASIPALRPLIQNKLVQALLPKWEPESFGVPCQGGWFSSLYGWKGEISSFNSSMYWPMLSSGSLDGKANKHCEINVNQQKIVSWESCKLFVYFLCFLCLHLTQLSIWLSPSPSSFFLPWLGSWCARNWFTRVQL